MVPSVKQHCLRVLQLLPAALLATASLGVTADTLSREERMELDLSAYRVTDTDASYFDVESRMAQLRDTDNHLLRNLQDELALGPSCRQKLSYTPVTTRGGIPGFYPNPEEWELATEPLFAFEDSVSNLASAFVASGDTFYADCLVKYLHHWAEAKALTTFVYDSREPQAWFASESMLFAAAMAYSIVRPYVDGMAEERAEVERWLHGLALQHSAMPGQPEESCCNNHFYRRALYASMIGVLVKDDELFRFGVSAVYSALHDMTESGAIPLEIGRGRRATHYQNYALNYLITNMQIIQRQGYDIFDLEYEGSTIHQAVDFLFLILDNPEQLDGFAPLEQYTGFLRDPQYFTWMDIYLTHFEHPRMERFVAQTRPTYNRSAGGNITFYFMNPNGQQHVHLDEEQRQTEAFRGLGD